MICLMPLFYSNVPYIALAFSTTDSTLQERERLSPGLVSRFSIKGKGGILVREMIGRIGEAVLGVPELQQRRREPVVVLKGRAVNVLLSQRPWMQEKENIEQRV